MRGCKNIFCANGKQKKAGVAILVSDKIDFKIKKIARDKEEHCIMINPIGRHSNCKYLCTQHRRTSIQRTNTNRYRGEIDSDRKVFEDLDTPLTLMDRSSKQKMNKECKS